MDAESGIKIDEKINELLNDNLLEGWEKKATKEALGSELNNGVEEFTDLLIKALNKSIMSGRLLALMEDPPTGLHAFIYETASERIMPLVEETSDAVFEYMKTMDDPLGVLMEMAAWVGTDLITTIAKINSEPDGHVGVRTG